MESFLSLNIEEEINQFLIEEKGPEDIADLLFQKIVLNNEKLDSKNNDKYLSFLMRSGRSDLILKYYQHNIKNKKFYWNRAYFIYGLIKSYPKLDEELEEIIKSSLGSAQNDKHWIEASRTKIADKIFPKLKTVRKKLKEFHKKTYDKKREELLHKFELFRSQQLIEPAKEVLKRLEKIFPKDIELKRISYSFSQQDAEAIFEKYKTKKKETINKPKNDPDVEIARQAFEKNLLTDLEKYSKEYQDLVILCLFIESYECALKIFKKSQADFNNVWLYVEILMKNKRFLEVLHILPIIEKNLSDDPETFSSSTYCRAICFWNLGEKNSALEVLESLINSRPNYRSAEVLFQEWQKI